MGRAFRARPARVAGDALVLDGITLRIRAGAVTGIIGGSGCGKSTLPTAFPRPDTCPQRRGQRARRAHRPAHARGVTLGTRDGAHDGAHDYELHGEITALEERDVPETDWRAHHAVRFQIARARRGKVAWERAFDSERPVAEKRPRAVVEPLEALLASEPDGLCGALEAYLGGIESGDRAAPASGDTSTGP